MFKSEAQFEQRQPDERTLGVGFVDWLKKNFQWMFATGQSSASVGTAFIYDEDANLLGEYDNGSARGKGRTEYIWLPTDDGQAIPIGIYRNGRMFAVHADHLGTPRVITDDGNEPVWQWPYSAFGNNKPSGVLKASQNPKAGVTNQAVLLKATEAGIEANLRFPGQYFDEESNLSYNYFRSYQSAQGRYTQADPIGLGGGLNRFTYVGEDPFSYYDSRGLDKITWGSKSGPLYGKWGGRDWSGGQRPSEHGGEMGSERPVDSLDFCAQQHDRCWDKADGSNLQCVADAASSEKKDYCNARFSACARRLGDDPNRWLVPPTPGTEIDASRYRRGAIFLGDHNFYRH